MTAFTNEKREQFRKTCEARKAASQMVTICPDAALALLDLIESASPRIAALEAETAELRKRLGERDKYISIGKDLYAELRADSERLEYIEREALFNELKLLAIGAASGCEITTEEGEHDLWFLMGAKQFSSWYTAAWRRWREASPAHIFEPYNLDEFATVESAADFMYRHGCRAGGRWTQ